MIDIYTDGSARDNLGVLGYTAYKDDVIIEEKAVTVSPATSNLAEILAVANALTTYQGQKIRIFSDSEYVVKTITGIYKPKKHAELWAKVISLFNDSDVTITHVFAHEKNARNNRIDKLVRKTLRSHF